MGVGRKHNTQKQHTRRAGETVAAKGAETGFLESLANLGVPECAVKSLNHHATQSQRNQRRGSRGSSGSHRRGRAWAGTVHLHTVPPTTHLYMLARRWSSCEEAPGDAMALACLSNSDA